MYPTLRAVASSCNLLPWTVQPSSRSSNLFTVTAGCLVFCFISACIFVYVFSCIFLLFFVAFISLLFCLGFSLHMVLWLIFEVETSTPFWFFAVPDLQLSLYSGGCFTRIELFTEFLCNLHRLVRPWNRPGLLIVLLELLAIRRPLLVVRFLWIGSRICSYICTAFYHLGLLLGSPPQFRF
jgi:hypothetical protein